MQMPVLQAGVFCQRTTDTVHPLIIDQIVCNSKINFFQGFNLTVAKKEIFEQIKKPRYVGVTWIYVTSIAERLACCSCIFSWSPLIFFFLNNAASNFPNLKAKFKRKNCWSRVRMVCCVKSADSVYTSDFLVRKMSLTLNVMKLPYSSKTHIVALHLLQRLGLHSLANYH